MRHLQTFLIEWNLAWFRALAFPFLWFTKLEAPAVPLPGFNPCPVCQGMGSHEDGCRLAEAHRRILFLEQQLAKRSEVERGGNNGRVPAEELAESRPN